MARTKAQLQAARADLWRGLRGRGWGGNGVCPGCGRFAQLRGTNRHTARCEACVLERGRV